MLAIVLFCRNLCHMHDFNVSKAAREVGCSRRTIQRYLTRYPQFFDLSNERYEGTDIVSRFRYVVRLAQTLERRGYPIGKRRVDRWLLPQKPERYPKRIGRTFEQRIVIIREEIESMSRDQKKLLLKTFAQLFPKDVFIEVEKEYKQISNERKKAVN